MASDDVHEWISIEVDGETYQFDLTFLTSSWRCIYGEGCPGIEEAPAPEAELGCCSHGAHFVDKADRKRVADLAQELTREEWQFKKAAQKAGGPIYKNDDGDWVTRRRKGACIFLNRPDFPGGAGCALHRAALERGERPIDWKPTVCWQLPLHLDYHTDDHGHLTYILREWKRRDWGEGGEEFHWWCTESPEAFIDPDPVYIHLRDDIVELLGEAPYEALVAHLQNRGTEHLLPHPVLRARSDVSK